MQVHSLFDSFNYALEGLIHTFKTQRNMKIHFAAAFLVLLSSLLMEISKTELIILLLSIALVMGMELINTAVEIIIDMISREYSYRAKIAKNIAAAGVFMASLNAAVTGYLVFIDEIRSVSFNLLFHIRKEPAYLIFVTLVLLVLLIISLKASKGRGTPLQGGMPSGHSAVAFSISMITILLTMNITIAILVSLLALMVAQSRVESGTHSLLEVFTGALIGILFTLLIFLFYENLNM